MNEFLQSFLILFPMMQKEKQWWIQMINISRTRHVEGQIPAQCVKKRLRREIGTENAVLQNIS